MTVAVTCDRCGVTLPGRTRTLPDAVAAQVVRDHQATPTCTAGTAARGAEGRGLVRLLHFETVLSCTLHATPDTINAQRAGYMRGCGVQVEDVLSKLDRLTKEQLKRAPGTSSFIVVAEPWAPLWAVAMIFSGAEPLYLRHALVRGTRDAALRQATEALVRCTVGRAIADSRTDLRGLLRAFVEGVAP